MRECDCFECGRRMVVGDDGVSTHLLAGGGIDHAADGDHVPFPDPTEDDGEEDADPVAAGDAGLDEDPASFF